MRSRWPRPRDTLALTLTLGLSSCVAPAEPFDPCRAGDDPSVVLGTGIGADFEPFIEGEEVELTAAPRGGFGLSVVFQTTALEADDHATYELEISHDGERVGGYTSLPAPLRCNATVGGGSGFLFASFDTQRYKQLEDLVVLNGELIEVTMSVTDSAGANASTRQRLTLVVP